MVRRVINTSGLNRRCLLPEICTGMDINLLKKYLENSCCEDEFNSVIEWFRQSSGTTEGRDILLRLLDEMPEDSDDNEDDRMDRLLGLIHNRIHLKYYAKLYEQVGSEVINLSRRRHILRILSRVAAVILTPVFLFGLYTSARYLSEGDETKAASMA
jgi:hypothetical protein